MPKIPSTAAGYMELAGAKKDAQCRKVEVSGGVSKGLGCCNEFHPESKDTSKFSCGTCEYVKNLGLGARLAELRP